MKVVGMRKWVALLSKFEMIVANQNHGRGGGNIM
jgi:hypothetical protein